MKKIHFENLSWNWLRITLLIIASISFITGYGFFLDYENSKITIIGFLIVIFLFSKRFWYKNYVEYNKLGIVIKLHFVKDKTIKFREIDKIVINDNELKLSLSSDKELNFKLANIHDSDKNKLTRILVENSNSKFTDNRTEMNTIANI